MMNEIKAAVMGILFCAVFAGIFWVAGDSFFGMHDGYAFTSM